MITLQTSCQDDSSSKAIKRLFQRRDADVSFNARRRSIADLRSRGRFSPVSSHPSLSVLSEYHLFTLCTEAKSRLVHCYWPNPLVESYIIRIHKHFFSNCTNKQVVFVDPPDNTLTILILIPVFLTLAMIALVVWCSKRSDILA